jgi:membrane-associated phospholipid phosphatase
LRRAGALVFAPLLAFVALAVLATGTDGRLPGDAAVMDVLNWLAPVSSDDVHIDPVLDATTLVVTLLVAAVGVSLVRRRELRAASYLLVAVAAPVLLSRVVKQIVERPSIEGPRNEYTFPSGSATWCVATVTALVLLAALPSERRVVAWAGAVITLPYSAIIAWEEWHHPSDVLAGWCLGLAGAAAAWYAFARPRAEVLRRRVAA